MQIHLIIVIYIENIDDKTNGTNAHRFAPKVSLTNI